MREVPPGPEWESMRHEAEEAIQRLNEQLLAGPPFPVYAALEPPLGDDALAGTQTSNGQLEAVELVCGDVLRMQVGPMLMVRSARLVVDEDKGA